MTHPERLGEESLTIAEFLQKWEQAKEAAEKYPTERNKERFKFLNEAKDAIVLIVRPCIQQQKK